MRKKRKAKEESLQVAVSTYLRLKYPGCIFTAESSGIRLTMGQAVKAKKQRSQRGLPDMMILEPRGAFFGLMIELKKEGGSPFRKDGKLMGHGCKSGEHLKEQAEAIVALNEKGYQAMFATGFDEAKSIIDYYMMFEPTKL